MERDPFPGVESFVDPTVTAEQIREAVNREDAQSRAFNPPPMTHEQMMQPVGGGRPAVAPPGWLEGFRQGRISGAVSERARIARIAWKEGNALAEVLDPLGEFKPDD